MPPITKLSPVNCRGFSFFKSIAINPYGDYVTDHEKWLKEQVVKALDKAGRGESVYFTEDEVEKKMDAFKKSLKEKHNR